MFSCRPRFMNTFQLLVIGECVRITQRINLDAFDISFTYSHPMYLYVCN